MDNKNQPAQVSSTQEKVRVANDVKMTSEEIRKNMKLLRDEHEKETFEIFRANEAIRKMAKTGAAPSDFMNVAKVLLDGTPFAFVKEAIKLHIAAIQGGNNEEFVFGSFLDAGYVLDCDLRVVRKYVNEIRQILSDQLEGSDNQQYLALKAKGAIEDSMKVALEQLENEFRHDARADPWSRMVKVFEDHEDGNTSSYTISPLNVKMSSD
ncbi:unnamed protein product [Caenorhabditis nigoni]|uniref:Uncharacterized protein n=1 Tax=Caenorhabditis nigoni TaxID=1611254 RepID=A0A2G5SS08_9PELO|nr:hypothetical protein B9Z55_023939 [Caenorhabditis nigoni]